HVNHSDQEKTTKWRKNMAKTKRKLEIRVERGDLEVRLDQSVFQVSLGEDGYVHFPESVRTELPGCMPKIINRLAHEMFRDHRNQAQIYLDVSHEFWCAELEGKGTCDCNPRLRDSRYPTIEENRLTYDHGKLTCIVCHESSTGRIISG